MRVYVLIYCHKIRHIKKNIIIVTTLPLQPHTNIHIQNNHLSTPCKTSCPIYCHTIRHIQKNIIIVTTLPLLPHTNIHIQNWYSSTPYKTLRHYVDILSYNSTHTKKDHYCPCIFPYCLIQSYSYTLPSQL